MTAEHVPVNPGAPTAPPVPQQGFQVPPAGPAAVVPVSADIRGPGQQPGWVQNPGQPQQGLQQGAQAPQQPQQGADLGNVVQLLQQALQGQQQAPTQQAPQAPVQNPLIGGYDAQNIDDPIIRSMATALQVAGKDIDLNRVLGNALALGNPALVDTAYLAEKGGSNAAQLAEIARGIVLAVNAKGAEITNEVYASVGGEANWGACVSAFNQTAPQELRVTISQMLDSKNPEFIRAGAKIVAEFGKTSGHVPQQTGNLLSVRNVAAGAAQGLSKQQFQAELIKLNQNSAGYEEARGDLYMRRTLGKRSGL